MVQADNPGEKLFPGMTANISCVISERTNVLKVANAALRFKPEKSEPAIKTGKPATPGDSTNAPPRGLRGGEKKPKLFVPQPDGSLATLRITTGITDGTYTEVSSDDLREGLEVVTAVLETGAKRAVVNPFMPTPTTPQTRPPRM